MENSKESFSFSFFFLLGFVLLSALLPFSSDAIMHGSFVYDDQGTVIRNPVLNPLIQFKSFSFNDHVSFFKNVLFKHDYWGTLLVSEQSHKSFRPLTTLTFIIDLARSEFQANKEKKDQGFGGDESSKGDLPKSYFFHQTNAAIHALVTLLVVFSVYISIRDFIQGYHHAFRLRKSELISLVAGLLFALHPIHCEAVANISGRAELLMATFYLTGFISHSIILYLGPFPTTNKEEQKPSTASTVIWTLLLLCSLSLFTILSMLSKETGFSMFVTCILFDIVRTNVTVWDVIDYFVGFARHDASRNDDGNYKRFAMHSFFSRNISIILVAFCIAMWRLSLNGSTAPDIIKEQNPAAFADNFLTRVLSIAWVHVLYMWDLIYPFQLCCDWSGKSIDLISTFEDSRAGIVILYYCFFLYMAWFTLFKYENDTIADQKIALIGYFGWFFAPFLLSSNILVAVGTMKADRVMYLPSMGYCFLCSFLIFYPFETNSKYSPKGKNTINANMNRKSNTLLFVIQVLLVMILATTFGLKSHLRSQEWKSALTLWESAWSVNKRSTHTMYNFGLELANSKRLVEAETLLKNLVHIDPEDVSAMFIYGLVLKYLGKCEDTLKVYANAIEIITSRKNNKSFMSSPRSQGILKDESNIITLDGLCNPDIGVRGKQLHKAISLYPSNEFATKSGLVLLKAVELYRKESARFVNMIQLLLRNQVTPQDLNLNEEEMEALRITRDVMIEEERKKNVLAEMKRYEN